MERDDLTEYVYERLARSAIRDDLILAVCQRSGKSWPDAEQFVIQVSYDRRRQITRRLAPFLIFFSVLALVSGGWMAYDWLSLMLAGPLRLVLRSQVNWAVVFNWPFLFAYGFPQVLMGVSLMVGGTMGVFRSIRSLFE